MKSKRITLLLVGTLLAGSLHAQIHVDSKARNNPSADGSAEYPFDDIQTAIDFATDGDTIIVAPGWYLSRNTWEYAELRFEGKNIRLVSSAPTDWTVIEQTVLCGVVIFDGTEGPETLLQGFKIQNHGHGGILGNGTQATVSHCIISGNGPCGGTVVKDIHGELRNCLIVDNMSFHDCDVLPVVSGCHTIINCTIANNISGVAIANEGFPPDTQVTIRNSIIYGNQGPPFIPPWNPPMPRLRGEPSPAAANRSIEYCLVDDLSIMGRIRPNTIQHRDPLFVRLGRWEEVSGGPPTRGGSSTVATRRLVLTEGDYRLRSKGWRWNRLQLHGSHWYYDEVTSPAIGAGDPLDGLGEELERAPQDPEGLWGINRAINLGAYGGTAQASLAPTDGEAPGIGAVDLRDYWPMYSGWRGVETRRWYLHNPHGNARSISVSGGATTRYGTVYASYVNTTNDPGWVTRVRCYYVDRALYLTTGAVINESSVEQPPAQVQARYPQFLVPGTTIEAPYDPFVIGGAEYRSALVLRGTLEDMLADTDFDPGQFVLGPWPDVIALREDTDDGAPGQLIAMFARGFGPLMLAGQPVVYALIYNREFANSDPATWPSVQTHQ